MGIGTERCEVAGLEQGINERR